VTAEPHLPPRDGPGRDGDGRRLIRIALLLAGVLQLAVPIASFGMGVTDEPGIGASIMLGIAKLLAFPALLCTLPGLVLTWRGRLIPGALFFLAGLALQWILLQAA
jgi:hypothetical protein